MPRPAKHHEISKLLKQRIASGMYLDQPIPGERALAAETGVSYMTARKAVQHLVEQNVLTRAKNGRLEAPQLADTKQDVHTYVLLTPAFESFGYQNIRMSIERVMSHFNGVLKISSYRHWHDPAIMSAFDGDWNGIFVIPPNEGIPKLLMDRMIANRDRIVVVYSDLTEQGFVSVDNSLEAWASVMVEHLASLGHDRVDCLNTQPGHDVLNRVKGWKTGVQTLGIKGECFNDQVENFDFNWVRAYEIALKALKSGKMANAVFCTTLATCKGLARAAFELGMQPGKDVHYCTMDVPYESIYEIPSVTTLNLYPLHHYVHKSFEWLEYGDGVLVDGNLLIAPDQAPDLLLGESTGFASKANRTKLNETYKDS
ncbi:MAG: GntR family transcriptional regulator [Phycisphaeraceae bacterium JB051]